MNKKFLAMLSAVVCGCLIFAGCGVGESLAKTEVAPYNLTASSLTNITTALDGGAINYSTITSNGNCVVTKNVEGKTLYGVFNFKTGTMVEAYAELNNINPLKSADTVDYIVVSKNDENGTEVKNVKIVGGDVLYENIQFASLECYAQDGKNRYEVWNIQTEDSDYMEQVKVSSKGKRKVTFTNKLVAGDLLSKKEQQPALMNIGSLFYELGCDNWGKLINVTSAFDYNNLTITNYNAKTGRVIGVVDMGNLMSSGVVPSKDGFVYQKATVVSDNASDYTAEYAGRKLLINTYKVNIITGKTKEIKTNFYLAGGDESTVCGGKIYTRGAVIKNKLIEKETILEINSSLKAKEVDVAYGSVTKLNKDYYFAVGETNRLLKDVYPDDSALAGLTNKVYEQVFQILDKNGKVAINLPSKYKVFGGNVKQMPGCQLGSYAFADYNQALGKLGFVGYGGKLLTDYSYDSVIAYANGYFVATTESTLNETLVCKYYSINEKTGEAKEIGTKTETSGTTTFTFNGKTYTGKVDVNVTFTSAIGGEDLLIMFGLYNRTADGKYDITLINTLGEELGTFTGCTTDFVTVYGYGTANENLVISVGGADVVLSYKNAYKPTIVTKASFE